MCADRYDASDSDEARYQPGSGEAVLLNKLDICSSEAMDEVELERLIRLYDWVLETVEFDQRLTTRDLKHWHRRWLGDVYSWAGEYRSVNLGKGNFQFAAAGQIARLMDVLDRDFLSRYTPCVNMTEAALVEAIAIVHVELILIHPFREGNGRMARLLANVMALQAGQPELDFSLWDEQKPAYYAAIQAGLDDYEPMKALVRQLLSASAPCTDE